MSRLDAVSDNERQDLKEEIKSELRHEARCRKALGCGACAVIWLVVIGVPIFFLGRALGKTGVVNLPWFTSRYASASTPFREVLPLQGSTASTILASLKAKTKYDPRLGTAKIPFHETELTTLLANGLDQAAEDGALPFALRDAQVAIEADMVELFAKLPKEGYESSLRIHLVPKASRGALDIEVKEVVVGDYRVPDALAKAAVDLFAKSLFDSIRRGASELGELNDIQLEQKKLTIVLIPSKK